MIPQISEAMWRLWRWFHHLGKPLTTEHTACSVMGHKPHFHIIYGLPLAQVLLKDDSVPGQTWSHNPGSLT